jgi:hypothetical protein
MNNVYFDRAKAAYLECAIWASTDENGEPLVATVMDIHPDAEASLVMELEAFITDNEVADLDPAQVGHDLWLTRNRHGAGFWDRGLGERGLALTEAAHAYGECYLYVGDNGWVYAM